MIESIIYYKIHDINKLLQPENFFVSVDRSFRQLNFAFLANKFLFDAPKMNVSRIYFYL